MSGLFGVWAVRNLKKKPGVQRSLRGVEFGVTDVGKFGLQQWPEWSSVRVVG